MAHRLLVPNGGIKIVIILNIHCTLYLKLSKLFLFTPVKDFFAKFLLSFLGGEGLLYMHR